ncbi:hypothetical protein [Clostridium perfringens]|uniref:Uncharacterized protein n=2 Tax=Clostridium perfringens TaxID=1502 RepID=A0AAP7BUJ6_CLOPF|nr:hypothetical protein [Clostridium perfringens]NGU29031.1 hypothetical protein [Clostridium perfringens]WEV04016.1 hypothetical protein PL322_08310 [Clostridium perfringens B]WEV07154.1 hypothetical protein PL324_08580 [Clostridium perfringens B]
MKIRLSQLVALEDFKKGCFTMTKEFESPVIPHGGDKIADSVWKDPYEHNVSEVIIDYSDNTCYVTLEPIRFENNDKDVLKLWYNMVESHGWDHGYLL